MATLRQAMRLLNYIYLFFGLLYLLLAVCSTILLYHGDPDENLWMVVLVWLIVVAIFSAFCVGRTALQTLDEKQLRRFGFCIVIGLILQEAADSLKVNDPHFSDRRDKNAEETESEICFFIAFDVFFMALQLLLVIFAFVSAERSKNQPNVKLPVFCKPPQPASLSINLIDLEISKV